MNQDGVICPECGRDRKYVNICRILRYRNDVDLRPDSEKTGYGLVSLPTFIGECDCDSCALSNPQVVNCLMIETMKLARGSKMSNEEAMKWIIENVLGKTYKDMFGKIAHAPEPDVSHVIYDQETKTIKGHKSYVKKRK